MRKTMIGILGLFLGFQTVPAQALTCVVPNLAQSFNNLHGAPETYVIGYGRFRAAEALPPARDGVERTAGFEFSGRLMGLDTDRDVTLPVTVRTRCLSIWCGGFPTQGLDMAVYLERNGQAYSLTVGPCPGGTHPNPRPDQLEALRTCLRQGICGKDQIGAFKR